MQTENLNIRAVFSFFATSLRAIASVALISLIAKHLGPHEYGRLMFLVATLVATKTLLDAGSSSAFFTFISSRKQTFTFFVLYSGWLLFQLLTPIALIWVFLPDLVIAKIFSGEQRYIIILAYVAVFFQYGVWQTVAQIGDSSRHTYSVQTVNLLIPISQLAILIFLIKFTETNIVSVLVVMIAAHLLGSIVITAMIGKFWRHEATKSQNKHMVEMKKHSFEFIKFCAPLVFVQIVSFFSVFLDRWMLQYFGGAEEQAYFSIGNQFSAVALLATSASLRILWKEFAEAYEFKNLEKSRLIFSNAAFILYLFALTMVAFAVTWAEEIIVLFLGKAYMDGLIIFKLMLFYPLHQVLGQLLSAAMYAVREEKILSIYNTASLCFGILLSVFLLSDQSVLGFGLALGATGLAIKMLVIQFINVNLLLRVVSKKYGFQFSIFLQITLIICALLIAVVSKIITGYLPVGKNVFLTLACGVILQVVISGICLLFLKDVRVFASQFIEKLSKLSD